MIAYSRESVKVKMIGNGWRMTLHGLREEHCAKRAINDRPYNGTTHQPVGAIHESPAIRDFFPFAHTRKQTDVKAFSRVASADILIHRL